MLDKLPSSVRDTYAGFWHATRVGPDPYADWTPSKAPWKFCYSSAYQGNSWRQEGLTVAKNIVADLQKKDLADGPLLVSDANNNASLQATQITTMVQKGCDVILVMQPPTVGVCKAFDTAQKAGVLVVVMQTGTDCTNVIQSDFGAYYAGQTSAKWLVDQVGDAKGSIVMCDGIPGVAAAEARQAGAADVFKQAGLKVDHITGEWTPSTIKSQMLSFLSTNQGAVAGVWDGGVCAVPVTQAFQQADRDLPWVTGFEGACSWLASWDKTGKDSIGFAGGAGQGVNEALKVAMRMLAGQKPKYNTLLYPLAQIDSTNVDQYLKPGMTLNSACNAQPAEGESVPDSYYDDLFTGDGKPATFDAALADLPIK
ncbi:substrate-binding domain-containing protein [Aeromicrobium sp. UC242_57]|uniref:substrate-binding domain-containing protein n=1 Tax=Aeromicrobium sp. UC242_57 TaxID=3374624 RepID=UPI0037917624